MDCPKCRESLQAAHLPSGPTVDLCPACQGAFYDAGEIRLDLEGAEAKASAFPCPKCASAMNTARHFGGRLEVEHCSSCGGVWFDAGEVLELKKLSGNDQVVQYKPGDPEAPSAPAQDRTSTPFFLLLCELAAEILTHRHCHHHHYGGHHHRNGIF